MKYLSPAVIKEEHISFLFLLLLHFSGLFVASAYNAILKTELRKKSQYKKDLFTCSYFKHKAIPRRSFFQAVIIS